MANILVIRLSAIGDVAMTVPVIYSAAKSNPQDTFTVLTQAFLMPVFMNKPANVKVIGINTFGAEKKLSGLLRFASTLSKLNYDIVLDLHDVLRTMIIRSFFTLKGKDVYVMNKTRKERKKLTKSKHKQLTPLRPVIERYIDVFKAAGLNYTDSFHSLFDDKAVDFSSMEEFTGAKVGKWIGLAPFARHNGKIYPIEKMEKVVASLSQREDITLFLFGGKGKEELVLNRWASQYPRVKSVVGKFPLDKELALMSRLDLLLCMDSANMHFASLVGTTVISVWGATHPYAGFYGYKQKPENAIQLDLSCRPCSVFGDKPCLRGDLACLNQINPEEIITKINEYIKHEDCIKPAK